MCPPHSPIPAVVRKDPPQFFSSVFALKASNLPASISVQVPAMPSPQMSVSSEVKPSAISFLAFEKEMWLSISFFLDLFNFHP